MLSSYSVIVPALNKQAEIARTLQSIDDSVAFFEANHRRANEVRGEVIVVDDGSTDATFDAVRERARTNPRLRLFRHHRSMGAGAARNTGVRMSSGDVLFFCDGDDLYFHEHLFLGYSLIEHTQNVAESEKTLLRVGDRGHVVLSAGNPIAAVRTGVHVKDAIHPFWKRRIHHTIPQNLCLLRECHEWGEGFPEEAVYKQIRGCEDVAYNVWLNTFFRVGEIDLETVEYVRYPGNSFDRQLRTFMQAPESNIDVTPEQQALHDIRFRLEDERIGYLLDKWRVLGPPRVSPAVLNWEAIIGELLQRQRWEEAVRTEQQAAEHGQRLPSDLTARLRRAERGRATLTDV